MRIIETEKGHWEIPDYLYTDNFNFDWRPNPHDRPYIHQFGTQWQRTGGPRFVAPEAEQIKYCDEQKAVKLAEPDKFKILVDSEVLFDWSWHPDDNEPDFIWVFGNQYLSAEEMPTIEYTVGNATQRKFNTEIKAQLVSCRDHWKINRLIDESKFDFSWAPHPWEPPFIYVWGNQYLSAEEMPTVEYHQPGATSRKYMNDRVAILVSATNNWVVHDKHIFPFEMDVQWTPHPWDPPYNYIWGNKWIPGEIQPTIEYKTPGAEENKYMGNDVILFPEPDRWKLIKKIDAKSFDFTWRPDPREPPFIYVWGNQYLSAEEMPTVEYHCHGAVDRKYLNDRVANLANEESFWVRHDSIVKVSFDWTWAPHPYDPPYIYVWGNKWVPGTVLPTLEYHIPGATERKYMENLVEVEPNWEQWREFEKVTDFDWSWRPSPYDPPYIYVWGNKHVPAEIQPTLEYHVPGATERKYMDKLVEVSVNLDNWKVLIPVIQDSFDWTWRPDPTAEPYIYVWGNKWNDATIEPTIEYHVPGATDRKYMMDVIPDLEPSKRFWLVNDKLDLETFDFTWRPNPHSPPQIYQWENNGPTYTVPGASAVVFMQRTEIVKLKNIPKYYIKTTLDDLVNEHPDEVFWVLNSDLNYNKFNFKWSPDSSNFKHINIFGNEVSKDTQTYYINGPMYMLGHRDINYIEDQTMEFDSNLSMFWIDHGNLNNDNGFENLKNRYPQIQKTRFLNSWVDTISRCTKKANTKLLWILSSELDYSDFEFDFYPANWQMNMIHVFGTQWSHWGNTYLVNSDVFAEDTKYVKIIEHLRNINHVRSKKAKTIACQHDVLYIDHGNQQDTNLTHFKSLGKKVYTTSYEISYLNTIKQWIIDNNQIVSKKDYKLWITSSVCDYSSFDFSWQNDPFQSEQIHVFSSEYNKARQKFGDTFLLNVTEFINNTNELSSLENYSQRVNYIEHITASRLQHPIISHTYDSQADALKDINVDFPYVELIDSANSIANPKSDIISLWDETRTPIIVSSRGATQLMVPSIALKEIKQEVYDYPYIDMSKHLTKSKPLDIVFISNGEPNADENYEHLLYVANKSNLQNNIIRVQNINGRVASQHAAANASNTNWYFLVNGKIKVNDKFDWSWQPDRLQLPKHYIFSVTNPVNGLCYGHQAIVANNKLLTLHTKMQGLDFTLDSLHEVVDMNCGVANYNTDEWTSWRTAFRESIKLKNNTDSVSQQRLLAWLSPGNGDYAEWSLRGAQDGVDYFTKVKGNMNKLLLSYDWSWIQDYYNTKYKNI